MPKAARLTGKMPLTGMSQEKEPQIWILDKEVSFIGRHPSAEITLPLPRISRQHAKITRSPQGYFLEDLGSRNGTFINGEEIGPVPQRLSTGDEIVLGGKVVLHFNDPYETIDGKILGRVEGVWINPETGAVWVDAQQVNPPLSVPQHALLSLLYQAEGKIVSRESIIAHVWANIDPAGVSSDSVNGLIKRLRARLEETQPHKDYIEVLRGHGLRLVQV